MKQRYNTPPSQVSNEKKIETKISQFSQSSMQQNENWNKDITILPVKKARKKLEPRYHNPHNQVLQEKQKQWSMQLLECHVHVVKVSYLKYLFGAPSVMLSIVRQL